MATTYRAPGIYVEEVPSVNQPIAGVGTNTVGFIGLVPNKIQRPEANPDYDPVLAELTLLIAEGKSLSPEMIAELNTKIQNNRNDIARSETADSDNKTRLDALTTQRTLLESEITTLEGIETPSQAQQDELAAKNSGRGVLMSQIAALQKEAEDIQKNIKRLKDEQIELEKGKVGEEVPLKVDQASVLHPYILREFEVITPPSNTKLCTNFTEYTDRFGSFSTDDPAYIGHRNLAHAVRGFFNNGGTRCFVARIASEDQFTKCLEAFESIDEVSIIAAPGLYGQTIWDALVTHCERCEDRFAILDSLEVVGKDENGPAGTRKEPELNLSLLNYDSPDYQEFLPGRNKNAAFYFPWIEVVDPAKQLQDLDPIRKVDSWNRGRVCVPPSGHIAGIYARTDEERGVHKAPANATILGALNVRYYIGKSKQAGLNPQGVNCIRNINGNVMVWGARTIGGDRNAEWKYINVRRLFLFLRESIDEGTQWVVFEPNDPALWGKIRRNLTAFLTNVWRSGALFGLTPEEAFYVKCDAELNPPEVRDLGQVVTEIGVAIVRPAEFVIFRITQDTGPRRR